MSQMQLDLTRRLFSGIEVPQRPEWSKIGAGDFMPPATDDKPVSSDENGSINFSANWNEKLHCRAFTTFRLFNPRKYRKGILYQITLKEQLLGLARLVELVTLRFDEITPAIAYLDTGYDLDTFRGIVRKMYSARVEQIEKALWNLLVLRWEGEQGGRTA